MKRERQAGLQQRNRICLNNALTVRYLYQKHIMVYIMTGMLLHLSIGIYGMKNSIHFFLRNEGLFREHG